MNQFVNVLTWILIEHSERKLDYAFVCNKDQSVQQRSAVTVCFISLVV